MNAMKNKTVWCHVGAVGSVQFIGKEAIFLGSGCHLYFLDLKTKKTSFYIANNARLGDGIKIYTGHRSLNFFAFAESCGNPKIYILTYPEFEIISILEGGSKEGYICLAFAETSTFISLSTVPNFILTVWNWRKGDKLGSSKSHIFRQYQEIKCNLTCPVKVAQLGTLTTSIHVWDVLLCGKKCIMIHHRVKMPAEKPESIAECSWSSDGSLYLLDTHGNIYQANSEYVMERIIHFTTIGFLNTTFAIIKGDFVVYGPNLQLRFYRKHGSTWELAKSLVPPESITYLECSSSDILIARTDRALLLKIMLEENHFEFIVTGETELNDFCLLYPVGKYICLLCHHNKICVIEIASGRTVSKYDLRGTAMSFGSNLEFPYLAVGYSNGILEMISVYDPEHPVSMAYFNLTQNPISKVYFSEFGRVMVAADVMSGEFFVLEGIPGGVIKVVANVKTNRQIVDFILVPSTNCYRLFVIPVTSKDFLIGNKIIRYCILNKNDIHVKEYQFKDKSVYYYQIRSSSKINRDRVFFLLPYNAKIIQEVEVRRGENKMRILRTISTAHQIRKNSLFMDKYHALTWSYDGFIIARTLDFENFVGLALPHHRNFGGVAKARIDPSGKYIVSLGDEQNLVCTDLVENEFNIAQQEELESLLKSTRYSLLFKRKTTGFEPTGSHKDYTWLEMDHIHQAELERRRYEDEKSSLIAEFSEVQEELRELLDSNINGPKNERLQLHEFNLDTKYFEEMKEANRIQCKDTEKHIKKYTAAQNKVCQSFIDMWWKPLQVRKRKLLGISDNMSVENYGLLPPDGTKMEQLQMVQEQLRLENYISQMDKFEPWKPMNQKFRKSLLEQAPSFSIRKEHMKNAELEEEVDSQKIDRDTAIAMAGSTASNFIEVTENKYSQHEMNTFYQLQLQAPITELDMVRLKEHFNKQFEAVFELKEREVVTMKERNARMRHIVDEINYFSEEKIYVNISDPAFSIGERPEMAHQVTDKEVPVKPYISPSQQAILDAKAAEEERIRLLLLADDFKERALITMMNGVLELRWEDELKKDVPMPKCMIEKIPEDFNEEDLRAVKEYEDKVKFLKSERERYKYLLDQEYLKIGQHLRESVKKFNSRLSDLLVLKIKVDAAILQEYLIVCKGRLNLLERTNFNNKELQLKKAMVANEELMQGIQNLISSLQDAVQECRSNADVIQNKDKILEKAFKKDLAEFNPAAQETAHKLLRRRPKVNYKAVVSTTLLQTLSKAVVSDSVPIILTNECKEYLKALANLDQYVGIPPTVDEACYQVVCKHRRFKIEHEIKAKASANSTLEAETTIASLQKRLLSKKEQNIRYMAELAQVRTDRLRRMRNMPIQLVIKQGFVEVPLAGNISDFKDAILIPRQEVEHINALILESGQLKLNAMRHTMSFHREIMKTEWLHKKFRMQIEDLREQINDIHALKLTKDMQTYLKGKEKSLPFEMEVNIAKQSYESIIKEMKSQVGKIRKQIKVLKDDSKKLDGEISDINVDVCECKLDKDYELEREEQKVNNQSMVVIAKRGKLVREIQENHNKILLLQTELEILRLKTYPTLKYKILD